MKATIHNTATSGLQPERVVQITDKEYISFGEKNLFPQELAKIGREAPTHRALINSKSNYIKGNRFITEDNALLDKIENINANGETLSEVLGKVIFDEISFGNGWLEIVKDLRGLSFNLYHIDSTKVRLSKDLQSVIIHSEWINYHSLKKSAKQISLYPNFTKDGSVMRSVMHIKQYEPAFTYYGIPNWYAALNSALIERATAEYNKNELKNTFSISGMLVVPGINDVDSAQLMEDKLKEYTGSSNNSKLLSLYLPDISTGEQRDKAELIDFRRSLNGSWLDLHRQSQDDLLKAHTWYPNLAGFPGTNGFDTNVILNEYNVALSTQIKPKQEQYLMMIYKIFSKFGYNTTDLQFVNESPIKQEITQSSVLNGAQVTSMQGILESVSLGKIPKESAVMILVNAFNFDLETAQAIVEPININKEVK